MIISLYSRNQPGVRGTINTDGEVPTATGVGETMLEAWLKSHEGQPNEVVKRSLEAFYSSWGNQASYSKVEPSGVTYALQLIEHDTGVTLTKLEQGVMQVRDEKQWRDVRTGDVVSGRAYDVAANILGPFDEGQIKSLEDGRKYKD